MRFSLDDKNFNFELAQDKNVHYIFGKNGRGKTSFSRQFNDPEEVNMVFNTDYITKNVYTTRVDSDIIKSNQEAIHKTNTFDIFFGAELINLNSIIDTCTQIISSMQALPTPTLQENINENCLHYIDESIITELIEQIDFSEINLLDNDAGTQIENMASRFILDKQVTTSEVDEINNIVARITEHNKIETLLVTQEELVNIIITINQTIHAYNSVRTNQSKDKELFKWMKEGIELHAKHELEKCEFCETNISIEKLDQIELRIREYENDKLSFITQLDELSSNIIEKLKKFKSQIEMVYNTEYNSRVDLIIESLKTLSIVENNDEKTEIDIHDVCFFEHLEIEVLKNRLTMLTPKIYAINFQKALFSEIAYKTTSNNKINSTKIQMDSIINRTKEEKIGRINHFLDVLNFNNIRISFSIDNRGGKKNVELKLIRSNITELSSGEKNALALAYFFADIETKFNELLTQNGRIITVFIDDPFSSNDLQKMFNLSSVKFNINGEERKLIDTLRILDQNNNAKYILSTHNMSFLQILLSNLIRGSDNNNYHFTFREFANNIGIYTIVDTENLRVLEPLDIQTIFINQVKILFDLFDFVDSKATGTTMSIEEIKIAKLCAGLICRSIDYKINLGVQELSTKRQIYKAIFEQDMGLLRSNIRLLTENEQDNYNSIFETLVTETHDLHATLNYHFADEKIANYIISSGKLSMDYPELSTYIKHSLNFNAISFLDLNYSLD